MEFPPIDEPTTVAINDVVTQCENARRLCQTALETNSAEALQPLLRRAAATYEGIVVELRDGLFGTAGEATGDGTVRGYFRHLKEEVGQRAGWRDSRHLLDALTEQNGRVRAAFDAALEQVTGARIKTILVAKRSVVDGLADQVAAAADEI